MLTQRVEILRQEIRKAIFVLRNRVNMTQADIKSLISNYQVPSDLSHLFNNEVNQVGALSIQGRQKVLENDDLQMLEEFKAVKTSGMLRKSVKIKKFQFSGNAAEIRNDNKFNDLCIEPTASNSENSPKHIVLKTSQSVNALIQTKSGSIAMVKKQLPLHLINRTLVTSRQQRQQNESENFQQQVPSRNTKTPHLLTQRISMRLHDQ